MSGQNLIGDRDFIYYIPPTSWVEGKGHRVSIVIKNEAGHFPTGGGDKEPWYWGNRNDAGESFKQAEATAAEMNVRRGYSEERCLDILSSSMAASRK